MTQSAFGFDTNNPTNADYHGAKGTRVSAYHRRNSKFRKVANNYGIGITKFRMERGVFRTVFVFLFHGRSLLLGRTLPALSSALKNTVCCERST